MPINLRTDHGLIKALLQLKMNGISKYPAKIEVLACQPAGIGNKLI
jgi:hypothetical protein